MMQAETADVIDRPRAATTFGVRTIPGQQTVLIVRDSDRNSDHVAAVCEFLDVGVEYASSGDDLRLMLSALRPIAVIADLDGEDQDGFHVMKTAAAYDPSLPVLLLTINDPVLLGAVDAVREIWGLARVATTSTTVGIGSLVDFICHAARDAGRSRMMRV